jgi:hypothetical protein
MSQALEELVGHVDWLERSLLFTHFRLEQGPISDIYRRSASQPSRDKTDAFMLIPSTKASPVPCHDAAVIGWTHAHGMQRLDHCVRWVDCRVVSHNWIEQFKCSSVGPFDSQAQARRTAKDKLR